MPRLLRELAPEEHNGRHAHIGTGRGLRVARVDDLGATSDMTGLRMCTTVAEGGQGTWREGSQGKRKDTSRNVPIFQKENTKKKTKTDSRESQSPEDDYGKDSERKMERRIRFSRGEVGDVWKAGAKPSKRASCPSPLVSSFFPFLSSRRPVGRSARRARFGMRE